MAFFQADNLWVELQDGTAILWLDVAGKTLNVLNRPALAERQLGARDALRWGLVDAVLTGDGGPKEWLGRLPSLPPEKRPKKRLPLRTLRQKLLESTRLGRSVLFRGAEAVLRKKTPDD